MHISLYYQHIIMMHKVEFLVQEQTHYGGTASLSILVSFSSLCMIITFRLLVAMLGYLSLDLAFYILTENLKEWGYGEMDILKDGVPNEGYDQIAFWELPV